MGWSLHWWVKVEYHTLGALVVKTGEGWMRPIVKLLIAYYVGHFYGGVNITMSTTTCITIDSRKRASGNTCDAVYFLDRTLQGVQGLRLSNMQFYNTIYNITKYNNIIAFSVTSSTITTPYSLTLAPGNYVVSEFTAALHTLMNEPCLGSLSLTAILMVWSLSQTASCSHLICY